MAEVTPTAREEGEVCQARTEHLRPAGAQVEDLQVATEAPLAMARGEDSLQEKTGGPLVMTTEDPMARLVPADRRIDNTAP